MKMNEVAGTGNWNTAEFGEYNTRTGIRANLDPKPNYSQSPYSLFSSNPIMFNDVLLDTPKFFGQPVVSPTNIPLLDNASIVEVGFTWLMNKTQALKPVIALEKHGRKNWYVERDSHYGPLGFQNHGIPYAKAIWGTGLVFVGGIVFAAEFSTLSTLKKVQSTSAYALSTYSVASDVKEAATGTGLPGGTYATHGSALIDFTTLLTKARNPLNVIGLGVYSLNYLNSNSESESKSTPAQAPPPNSNNKVVNGITGKLEEAQH